MNIYKICARQNVIFKKAVVYQLGFMNHNKCVFVKLGGSKGVRRPSACCLFESSTCIFRLKIQSG